MKSVFEFIDLDQDTMNPDPHHWKTYVSKKISPERMINRVFSINPKKLGANPKLITMEIRESDFLLLKEYLGESNQQPQPSRGILNFARRPILLRHIKHQNIQDVLF